MAKQQSIRILSPLDDAEKDRKPRNFYIWGHQPHFAIDVKVTAESLFKKLDETIIPDTFVVAINTEKENGHPISVVEPDGTSREAYYATDRHVASPSAIPKETVDTPR